MDAPSGQNLIAEIPKNNRECYRVALGEYKGFEFVDVRVYFGEAGARKPSAKGVAIRPSALAEVITALQEAQRRLGGAS